MIDYQKEVERLAASHPDVLRFFQQASGITGYSEALTMLLEARGRAMHCLRVEHTHGAVHVPRFSPPVMCRELAGIAGCTHITTLTTEYLDGVKAKELEDER